VQQKLKAEEITKALDEANRRIDILASAIERHRASVAKDKDEALKAYRKYQNAQRHLIEQEQRYEELKQVHATKEAETEEALAKLKAATDA
jgi:hypothetical protein